MPLIHSKRDLEGYLEIQAGAGITPEEAARVPGAIALRRNSIFKSPTINCSHCKTMVVLNPNRSRERGYCPKCDHYVCDGCEHERVRTGVCIPFTRMRDDFLDRIGKGLDPRPVITAFEQRVARGRRHVAQNPG